MGIHIVSILKLSFILHLSSCGIFCGYKSLLSFHSHSNIISGKKGGWRAEMRWSVLTSCLVFIIAFLGIVLDRSLLPSK